MEDRSEWLRDEVRMWARDGLVTPEQASAIVARYSTSATPGAVDRSVAGRIRSAGKIVVAISVLGAVLLGIGVILFFASNWEDMPKALRVVLLFGATAGTYYAGYALRFKPGAYPRVGFAIIFLGALLYGASIFLTAQMFNVNENALDDLLLLWLAGTLPLAYALRNELTSALNLVLAAVWLNFQLGDMRPSPELHAFAMFNVALGAAFYALGKLHAHIAAARDHAIPYRYLGAFLAAAALYVMTFDFGRADVIDAPRGSVAILLLVLAALAAGLAAYTHVRARSTRSESALETSVLAGIALLPALFIVAPIVAEDLVMNLALAGFLVALIVIGYRSADVSLVNVALLLIAVDVVTRYFDFFYDLLPRSLFFMAGGALLLAGAFVGERQRRKLVAKMREEAPL